MRNRQYQDKEGKKKYISEVVADQILLLDKKQKPEPIESEDNLEPPLPFLKRRRLDCPNDNTKSIIVKD